MTENTYLIHDNGGRPFRVSINGHTVNIFMNNNNNNNNNPFLTYEVERIFIGASPYNSMTSFSGGYGPRFDGNSILVKLVGPPQSLNYIFIGSDIFSFQACSEILEYVSPVSNNDVPYPYAVDKDRRFYLLIENVLLQSVPEEYQHDPYVSYYYPNHYITEDMSQIPSRPPPIPNFRGIVEWFCGENQYNMTYHTDPSTEYDRLTDPTHENFGPMSIYDVDGNRSLMSKELYISVLQDFGNRMGFSPLPNKVMIQTRL